MIGKLLGALVGERIARSVSGAGGALLGAAIPMVMRRLGPAGFLMAAAGGYALKRHYDKQGKEDAAQHWAER